MGCRLGAFSMSTSDSDLTVSMRYMPRGFFFELLMADGGVVRLIAIARRGSRRFG